MEKTNQKSNSVIKYFSLKLISIAILLISSGKLTWIGAWTIFGFDCLTFLLMITIGKKYFPETVRGRAQTTFEYTWDKVAMLIYSLGFYLMYLIGGLTLRFSISSFDLQSYLTGILFYIFALSITFWVYAVNPFAIGSARIQKERNQKLITNGPYQLVRHPMYFAIIFFTLGVPLILSSPWAFIVAPIIIGNFIYRCYKEDNLLLNGLDGYKEYTQKVKYRMIPFIW